MGSEFTNALSNTPLWQFALHVYPQHHSDLLDWQDNLGASVNDLLALAFAIKTEQSLVPYWWRNPWFQKTRPLLLRTRKIRLAHKCQPDYSDSQRFELEQEGIDIMLLQQCLIAQPTELTNNLSQYANHLGIKKGTLAPFLQSLLD